MMLNDFKRALYDFSGAILNQSKYASKQPKEVKSEGLSSFYLHGGKCNYYLGQYEEALAHYQIAIEKHESKEGDLLGQIYYYKGLAHSSLQDYAAAIESQNKALSVTSE